MVMRKTTQMSSREIEGFFDRKITRGEKDLIIEKLWEDVSWITNEILDDIEWYNWTRKGIVTFLLLLGAFTLVSFFTYYMAVYLKDMMTGWEGFENFEWADGDD